ncbi:MAG TPA: glycosyl hydrolase, partial [bacterium]|nr:glycosyl hydrolase [bacterium]
MHYLIKMNRYFLLLWAVIIVIMMSGCAGDSNRLYSLFQDPPTEARPFVRWWWNGDRINEEEILRELDVLHEAGIGGVEINPIAMPPTAVDIGAEPLEWLSPEWNRMVKVAADGAHQRGMIPDMIVGTGWPFGGRFLPPEEQIKGVVLQKLPVQGSTTFENKIQNLIERQQTPEDEEAPEPELLFLRLIPEDITSLDQVQDLTDQVTSDGMIRFEVPSGDHILYLGSIRRGMSFREVTLGAPGADGPCLDHYNASAVRRYIQRVADSLGTELEGKLGNALRALFVDSIELSGSNWTQDLLEEFRSRRGYDLEPYYQFIFYEDPHDGYQDTFAVSEDLADTIRRVRYDYNLTLVELFLERFTETYYQWCKEQNTQSRYQAYGTPWLMGMAEGYMIPDIPESNNWLFSPNAYSHGYYVWNKYTSAGAHLTGRPIASCEAMTNTRGVFKTSLNMIKQADDMNFIMGINHSVLHGFNYSPPEAGFPGWIRFGAYFSEHNTWWPYFHNWVDYNARLSAVFQAAKPQVSIGILVPRADIWSTSGLARVPVHTTPWYGHRLWEAISQNGASADYLSETVIQDAEKTEGELRYGPMGYGTLIFTNVRTMEVATAEAIGEFVRSGGTAIFVESQPQRSASLPGA